MRASLMLSVSILLLAAFNTSAKAHAFFNDESASYTEETGTSDANGAQIDAGSFFQSIKGRYSILLAGGIAPHGNDIGSVEIEDQVILTFGFCPPGAGCDPGYIFLDNAKTKVFQTADGYTITSDDNGKATKYTWTISGDKVSFKNFQYVMPNNSVTTLEHVIKKQ